MACRYVTPPALGYYSDTSLSSFDGSPGSNYTVNTTPPASPIRQHGPLLLPKVRTQDQVLEPSAGPAGHRKTSSTVSAGYPVSYNPYIRLATSRASTPPDSELTSPVSVASYDAAFASALNSPVDFGDSRSQSFGHVRSSSLQGHTRSTSLSGVDDAIVGRYGYPTYRRMPTYISAPSVPSRMTSITVPQPQVPQVTVQAPAVQAPAVQMPQYSSYSQADCGYAQSEPTTTLLDYLTAPNPTPALVHRVVTPARGQLPYFWWDIRNLRSWDDFNVSSISSIEGLLRLLTIDVPQSLLPVPARVAANPDSEQALYNICSTHHAAKTNAGLAVALGAKHHIAMRCARPRAGAHQKPDFVASYPSDLERTIAGDSRGRVVGIVRAYDQWNTGMRTQDRVKQIAYLQGLAALHHAMREHGCRYGYIMTEIELVCVRAGGPNTSSTAATSTGSSSGAGGEGAVPLFGHLELSTPIQLSVHGRDARSGALQMTADLALWYLHMLAKESPLPGMGSWRMDVGAPAARTRAHCAPRDAWMGKIGDREKRDAKSVRGWVWPEDPSSRKEFGKRRRRT